jgi:hypothetical protein
MAARERAGLPREKPQFGHEWWPMCSAECESADREYNRARLAAKGQPGLRLPPRRPLSVTSSPASPRWGAITPEKKLYDAWTAEHFQSRGWQAFVINRTGRFADVLARRGNRLAVIEVKSPNELSSSPSWETRQKGDSGDLSPPLAERHEAYLQTARVRVCDLLRGYSTVVRFYGMVIAAQLYRYYFEFEERASQYESFTGPIKLRGVSKLPFLVVPAVFADELRTATKALAAHGFVVSPRFETTPRLAMASFSYP